MKRIFLFNLSFLTLFLTAGLNSISFAQTDKMMNEWEKMNQSKAKSLQAFKELKFGMFIHWGLYAIPAGIWKDKKMEDMGGPNVAEWIQLAAKIPRKEYAALASMFNPVSFNPDEIVKTAKEAGMNTWLLQQNIMTGLLCITLQQAGLMWLTLLHLKGMW